jgi:hypothetical protein
MICFSTSLKLSDDGTWANGSPRWPYLYPLSGLEAVNSHEIDRRLKRVDEIIDGRSLDPKMLKSKPGVTAERLYSNQKITDLVAKAEAEQNDYRRTQAINVFLARKSNITLN